MQTLFLFSLLVAGSAAGDATCGTIKALYSDESCCGAPAEQTTDVSEVIVKDYPIKTASAALLANLNYDSVSSLPLPPAPFNPCSDSSVVKRYKPEGKNAMLTLKCKYGTKMMVEYYGEGKMSMGLAGYRVDDNWGPVLDILYPAVYGGEIVPGYTFEFKQDVMMVNTTSNTISNAMTMYMGTLPRLDIAANQAALELAYCKMGWGLMAEMMGGMSIPGFATINETAYGATTLHDLMQVMGPFIMSGAWNDTEFADATMGQFIQFMPQMGAFITVAPPGTMFAMTYSAV